MFDGRFYISDLLPLITPHQKHSGLDSAILAKTDGGLHLFDLYPALHCIKNFLRTAFGADPEPETSQFG